MRILLMERYVPTLAYSILAYACIAKTQFGPWAVHDRHPFMNTIFAVIEAPSLY